MLLYFLTLLLATHHTVVAIPQMPSYREATEEELDNAAMPRENFDPSNANTYHNLSCVGDRYTLELPLQQGWNPNERTMQQLCAKPQYYGGPPGQHVGGWCHHNEVVFDGSADAQISTELANPRILLGCRYRCFCNHIIPVENRNVQPKPNENQAALRLLREGRESLLTYEIRLDVQDDFTMPLSYNQGSFEYLEVDVVRLSRFKEVRHQESLEIPRYEYVSEDEGNKITCSGNLPTFPLPSPYSATQPNSDFQNNQQLCATQLNGGLLGANAGGYCHRSDKLDPTGTFFSHSVWFSDEMTPRLDWTWDGRSFFASASIRLHCYLNCHCSLGQNNNLPTARAWQFVEGHQLAVRDSGQIDLEAIGDPSDSAQEGSSSGGDISSNSSSENEPPPKRRKTTLMSVLPRQNAEGNRSGSRTGTAASGSCGSNGREFCPQPWPTSLLGAIPSAPPDSTEVVKPGPEVPVAKGAKADLTVCGNQCQGPYDCASPGNDTDHVCTCAFPNTRDAKGLGLDPVMPVSVCLVLMTAAFGNKQVPGRLGGRDASPVDSEGVEWLCRCNMTFTHNLCCGSRDGMVWLD